MPRPHSDINERLPRFRQALEAIDDTAQRGGYEGVDVAILDYLEGMEPVGLDESGTVVLPSSYRPENGPPVLMVKPHEAGSTIILPGTDAEAATATRIARQSHTLVQVTTNPLRRAESVSRANASISFSQLGLMCDGESAPYYILVPQLLSVSPTAPQHLLGSTLAHEADHWDFDLQSGTLQNNPQRRYTLTELSAIAEKRAYSTTRTVEQNLGQCATLASLDVVAEEYTHFAPADMGEQLRDRIDSRWFRELYSERHNEINYSLAVAAITKILGNPDTLVTPEEVIAMQYLQVI